MDDDDEQLPSYGLRIGTGVVLLLRIWADGIDAGQPAIRGHLSVLGGRHIGSFSSLSSLFTMIEKEIANPSGPFPKRRGQTP
jgi:hypothetical protein